MKNIGTLFLACILLLSVCIVFVSAEEFEPFTFQVKGVNGQISGEDCILCTTQEAYDSCNAAWAVTVLCRAQEDGRLLVVEQPIAGSGSVPDVSIGDGIVALVVHSATSDPTLEDQYPNVYGKLAALSAVPGMVIVLEGVDLENGTGSGSATLYESVPDNGETGVESEATSGSDTTSSEAESSVAAVSEEESDTDFVSSGVTESSVMGSESASSTVGAVSEASNGLSQTTIILLVLAAIVLVVVIVVIVMTKRKK